MVLSKNEKSRLHEPYVIHPAAECAEAREGGGSDG